MAKKGPVTPVVNCLLRAAALCPLQISSVTQSTGLQLFDGSVRKYFAGLDNDSKTEELRRIVGYMRRQDLVTDTDDTLKLTDKGRRRLQKLAVEDLEIEQPRKWDGLWRICFYDVPESKKHGRDELTARLKQLGCYQLQRSVWLHPFPYDDALQTICGLYGLKDFVTYIEASSINNEADLHIQFPGLRNNC